MFGREGGWELGVIEPFNVDGYGWSSVNEQSYNISRQDGLNMLLN